MNKKLARYEWQVQFGLDTYLLKINTIFRNKLINSHSNLKIPIVIA